MRKLFMSYAEVRRMHGKEAYHRPSRFLREIPVELIDEVRFRTRVSRPSTPTTPYRPATQSKFRIGQEVNHRVFGDGIILDMEGDGDDMKIKVRFANVGTKIMMAGYLAEK